MSENREESEELAASDVRRVYDFSIGQATHAEHPEIVVMIRLACDEGESPTYLIAPNVAARLLAALIQAIPAKANS